MKLGEFSLLSLFLFFLSMWQQSSFYIFQIFYNTLCVYIAYILDDALFEISTISLMTKKKNTIVQTILDSLWLFSLDMGQRSVRFCLATERDMTQSTLTTDAMDSTTSWGSL